MMKTFMLTTNDTSLYFLTETIVAPVSNVNNQEQGQGKESDSLRICNHCLDMLECRRRVQIEQMIQPIICQLYSHLQKNKFQIQNSVDMYNKVNIFNVYYTKLKVLM